MKNFFKKLSFVMAAAMVVTSLHVPAEAKAASKDYVYVKGSKKAVTTKSLFVGGQSVNFDYVVGSLKNKGANGKWSVTDSSVATVDKNGVVTAVNVGETELIFKAKKSKKVKKAVKKVVKITTYARAEEVSVSPAALDLVVGSSKEAEVTLKVKEELEKAGVMSSYNVFAEVDNATAVAVKVDKNKVMVEAKEATTTAATIKVYAAQKNTLEAAKTNKYMKMAEVKVNVMNAFTVKQAGPNKIKVMGKDLATDPALYVVKNERGIDLTLKKAEAKLNAEKTEAILESEAIQIFPAKYNLTFNNKEKAEFEVEKSVVKSIKLVPDNAAILDIKDATKKTVLIGYKVFDQFDDDITETSIPDLSVSTSASETPTVVKGLITAKNQTEFRQNAENISVIIVDKNTGAKVDGILPVSDQIKAADVKYIGLYDFINNKPAEYLVEDNKIEEFAMLFEVKDQYGKVFEGRDNANTKDLLTGAAGIQAQISFTISGITGVKAASNPYEVRDIKYTNDKTSKKYLLVKLEPSKDNSGNVQTREGAVDVTAICLNNGKLHNASFDVKHRVKIDRIIISEGSNFVFTGQDNTLNFKAFDMDGKEVTEYKHLKAMNKDNGTGSMRSSDGGNLRFVEDKDGKGVLKFKPLTTPGDETSSTDVRFSVTTETNKFENFAVNVYAKRNPKIFKGLREDFNFGVAAGSATDRTIEIKSADFIFVDQFGKTMNGKEVAALHGDSYGINAEGTATAFTYAPQTGDSNDGFALKNSDEAILTLTNAIIANTTKDDIKFTFVYKTSPNKYLKNYKVGDSEVKTITFNNVLVKDMEKFEIAKIDKTLPAADLYTDKSTEAGKVKRTYRFRPTVYGYYRSQKIKLDNRDFVVFDGITKTNVDTATLNVENVNADGVKGEWYVKVPDMASIPKGQVEATEKAVVIVKDTDPKVMNKISAEYKYSKAAPKVAKIAIKENAVTVTYDTDKKGLKVVGDIKVTWTKSNQYELMDKVDLEDQYGYAMKAAENRPYVTFSFAKSENNHENLMHNGALDAEFNIKADDNVVKTKVEFRFTNGVKPLTLDLVLVRKAS